jgi:putative transposase
MIERSHRQISIRRQCTLVGLNRSSLYYPPTQATEENLLLMQLIDQQYTRTPFYGSRRMTHWLGREGHEVNRKRVQRLMRKMGLEAVYPRPRLSQAAPERQVYTYLLRGIEVQHPDQVWSTDITYVPMKHGSCTWWR